MTWAIEQKCGGPSTKMVLLMLANHTNGHTMQCNPKHKLLAEECEMRVETLKSHLKRLSDLGLIEIVPQFMDGVQLPNQYRLTPENSMGGGGENRTGGGCEKRMGGGGENRTPYNQELEPGIEPIRPPLTPQGGGSVEKPAKFSPEDVELPDWLPRNCWLEWCTHRKQIRKPMTSLATSKAIMFLQEQHASGTEPEAIIEQAIRSGWQGLYPLKRSQTNVNENNHARVIRAHLESHDFITDEELAAMRSDAERRKCGVWGSRC